MSEMELRRGAFILWTLWKAEQVVWLLAVAHSLEVFVAVTAFRHDDIDALTVDADVEGPLAGFNPGNCFLQSQLPLLSVAVSSNRFDALMRVLTVGFVDALDLVLICHFVCFSIEPDGSAHPECYS